MIGSADHASVASETFPGVGIKVSGDGSVTNPGAVVAAVQSEPGRLRALGEAITGGAKDAVLSIVKGVWRVQLSRLPAGGGRCREL